MGRFDIIYRRLDDGIVVKAQPEGKEMPLGYVRSGTLIVDSTESATWIIEGYVRLSLIKASALVGRLHRDVVRGG